MKVIIGLILFALFSQIGLAYQYCIDNDTLVTINQIGYNYSSYTLNDTQPCLGLGCDNYTLSCNPSRVNQGLYLFLFFIVIVVAIAVLLFVFNR